MAKRLLRLGAACLLAVLVCSASMVMAADMTPRMLVPVGHTVGIKLFSKGVLINVTGSMDIGLEEVEQAASLVQAAVHPDALTIFGATFDETLDDEIRVTVIATGFDKAPDTAPVSKAAAPKAAAQAVDTAAAAPAPQPLKEEDVPKPEDDDDDVFGDILKIFSKRD